MNKCSWDQRLREQELAHRYRRRMVFDGPSALHIRNQQQSFISFSSNDYLGLANHPRVIAAFQQGTAEYGVGSGAAQLIGGHRRSHHELELAFAEFSGFPRALLFANGYMANLGVLTALTGNQDVVYQDRYNHASLLDAGSLAAANSRRYLHVNVDSLEKHLQRPIAGDAFIATDAVFSMSGAIAPLPAIQNLAQRYRATIIIDEAHGLGVLGKHGRGALEQCAMSPNDDMVVIYPLGKAIGAYGAVVVGSELIIESLIQFARSYIYTTALPAALACAASASLQILREEVWRREKLAMLIKFFRHAAQERQLPINDSLTAIQTISMRDSLYALQTADNLQRAGFYVYALRPPTVPKALLRITLRVDHSEAQIIQLLDTLIKIIRGKVIDKPL